MASPLIRSTALSFILIGATLGALPADALGIGASTSTTGSSNAGTGSGSAAVGTGVNVTTPGVNVGTGISTNTTAGGTMSAPVTGESNTTTSGAVPLRSDIRSDLRNDAISPPAATSTTTDAKTNLNANGRVVTKGPRVIGTDGTLISDPRAKTKL